jgi:hypothetical protein
MDEAFASWVLDYSTPTDPGLQAALERIDAAARHKHGLAPAHTDVGLLDLRRLRLAMIHPDRIESSSSR